MEEADDMKEDVNNTRLRWRETGGEEVNKRRAVGEATT